MEFSRLQSLRKCPSGQAVTVNKTFIDDSTLIKYDLVSEVDSRRYHVLGERELEEEAREILEAQETMLLALEKRTKKPSLSGPGRAEVAKETERFKGALENKTMTGDTSVDNAILNIMENDGTQEKEHEVEYARNGTHAGSWGAKFQPSGFGVKQSPDTRINYTMTAVQSMYHKNVDVIEQLYDENGDLKKRVESLERELIQSKQDGFNHYPRQRSPRSPRSPRTARSARSEKSYSSHTIKSSASRKDVLSAEDMANKFAPSDCGDSDDRSKVSRSLLADVDRYLQRRRAVDIFENKERQEEEAYRKQLEKRFKKAAQGTVDPFLGVEERTKTQYERKEAKIKETRDAEVQAEKEARKQQQMELSAHIKKGTQEPDMTYDAYIEQEEMKRKERIERRQNELLFTSKAPIDIITKATVDVPTEKTSNKVICPDPKTVIDNLEVSSYKWKKHLEKQKAALEEKREESKYTASGNAKKDPVAGMESRAAESAARREARLAEKARKDHTKREENLTRRKLALSSQILNAPVPEGGRRLTAAVENRVNMISTKKAKEQKEKQEKAMAKKRTDIKNKEMVSSMRYSIKNEDAIRKQQHGAFVECSGFVAQERAEQAAVETQNRVRANKQRIAESLKKRPSLLKRHQQTTDRQNAIDRALGIVSELASNNNNDESKSESKESSSSYDYSGDFMSAKERWTSGMRDNEAK